MVEMDAAEEMIEKVLSFRCQEIDMPIEFSVGHVILEDIKAAACVPEFRTSIMDGYAVVSRCDGRTMWAVHIQPASSDTRLPSTVIAKDFG